jgi:glycosyltransferase involved in cell wall biosynthesis
MNKRQKISVLIPTYNCADILRPTLDSVTWADEILIVDSYSTDDTLALCKQYGARILQHEYETPARQKNWAIPQCSYDWVLQLDSDEVLEPGVKDEICSVIQSAPEDVHAFRFARKNHILGKWVQHGGIYPDYQTRLFRRDLGQFEDRQVHEHLIVSGRIGEMQGQLIHFGMENISKQLRNLDRYTRYEADELHSMGRKFQASQLFILPWRTFLYRFLWQQGFRDGWRGLIVCAHAAIYQFFAHAKLWELEELHLGRSPY